MPPPQGEGTVVYHTVFDAGASTEEYWSLVPASLAIAGCGLAFCFMAVRYWNHTESAKPFLSSTAVFGGFVAAVCLAGTLVFIATINANRADAKSTLDAGDYDVATGTIEDFQPEINTTDYKRDEQFRIGTKAFHYSMYLNNGGFNQTKLLGGPVHNGVVAKVCYHKNRILRLEIAGAK